MEENANIISYNGLNACLICSGQNNDDLIILCDGHNCNKEAHLYCLQPVLYSVPKDDWYCDTCSEFGSSSYLSEYFKEHQILRQNFLSSDSYSSYERYRWFLFGIFSKISKQSIDLLMKVNLVEDEFVDALDDGRLIGSKVSFYCSTDDRHHIGRIIDSRKETKEYGRCNFYFTEHLVLFKSGADGRNCPLLVWCVLREHACVVFPQLLLVRTHSTSTWLPAFHAQRSSLYKMNFYQDSESTLQNNELKCVQFLPDEELSLVDINDHQITNFDIMHQKLTKATSITYMLALSELEEVRSIKQQKLCRTKESIISRRIAMDSFPCKIVKEVHDIYDQRCESNIMRLTVCEPIATAVNKRRNATLLSSGVLQNQMLELSTRQNILILQPPESSVSEQRNMSSLDDSGACTEDRQDLIENKSADASTLDLDNGSEKFADSIDKEITNMSHDDGKDCKETSLSSSDAPIESTSLNSSDIAKQYELPLKVISDHSLMIAPDFVDVAYLSSEIILPLSAPLTNASARIPSSDDTKDSKNEESTALLTIQPFSLTSWISRDCEAIIKSERAKDLAEKRKLKALAKANKVQQRVKYIEEEPIPILEETLLTSAASKDGDLPAFESLGRRSSRRRKSENLPEAKVESFPVSDLEEKATIITPKLLSDLPSDQWCGLAVRDYISGQEGVVVSVCQDLVIVRNALLSNVSLRPFQLELVGESSNRDEGVRSNALVEGIIKDTKEIAKDSVPQFTSNASTGNLPLDSIDAFGNEDDWQQFGTIFDDSFPLEITSDLFATSFHRTNIKARQGKTRLIEVLPQQVADRESREAQKKAAVIRPVAPSLPLFNPTKAPQHRYSSVGLMKTNNIFNASKSSKPITKYGKGPTGASGMNKPNPAQKSSDPEPTTSLAQEASGAGYVSHGSRDEVPGNPKPTSNSHSERISGITESRMGATLPQQQQQHHSDLAKPPLPRAPRESTLTPSDGVERRPKSQIEQEPALKLQKIDGAGIHSTPAAYSASEPFLRANKLLADQLTKMDKTVTDSRPPEIEEPPDFLIDYSYNSSEARSFATTRGFESSSARPAERILQTNTNSSNASKPPRISRFSDSRSNEYVPLSSIVPSREAYSTDSSHLHATVQYDGNILSHGMRHRDEGFQPQSSFDPRWNDGMNALPVKSIQSRDLETSETNFYQYPTGQASHVFGAFVDTVTTSQLDPVSLPQQYYAAPTSSIYNQEYQPILHPPQYVLSSVDASFQQPPQLQPPPPPREDQQQQQQQWQIPHYEHPHPYPSQTPQYFMDDDPNDVRYIYYQPSVPQQPMEYVNATQLEFFSQEHSTRIDYPIQQDLSPPHQDYYYQPLDPLEHPNYSVFNIAELQPGATSQYTEYHQNIPRQEHPPQFHQQLQQQQLQQQQLQHQQLHHHQHQQNHLQHSQQQRQQQSHHHHNNNNNHYQQHLNRQQEPQQQQQRHQQQQHLNHLNHKHEYQPTLQRPEPYKQQLQKQPQRQLQQHKDQKQVQSLPPPLESSESSLTKAARRRLKRQQKQVFYENHVRQLDQEMERIGEELGKNMSSLEGDNKGSQLFGLGNPINLDELEDGEVYE